MNCNSSCRTVIGFIPPAKAPALPVCVRFVREGCKMVVKCHSCCCASYRVLGRPPLPLFAIAIIGDASPLSVMMMLNIWIPLPIIHIMKHMNATWRMGAVAAVIRA
eukprot:GHUV01040432.1.p1 GENE.GHUV01040432.1~~GHUV01040432.1.p1  ORF type:complete len:106 (+),score=12.23 GHUV01040432.1:66-383(+)